TSIVKDGMMYVQACAGFVSYSVTLSEHQECELMASALFRAGEMVMALGCRPMMSLALTASLRMTSTVSPSAA
ncbi:MAG: hypothetical protein AAFX39_12750, partial [Pseudomonadota bacterium]